MKLYSLFVFLLMCHFTFAQQDEFVGSYNGVFTYGNYSSDIAFTISNDNDQYLIRFNSLEQNAFGIPARDIVLAHDTLKFALQSDFYRYDFSATLAADKSLKLNLIVDGKSVDFKLNKLLKQDEQQVRHKDIRFRSGNLLLYGTVYYPENPNGKAVYLVTSSGNNDRSATRAEAILLAQSGYITMHTDKRGTGISDGNWQKADIPELCNDDMSAIKYLSQVEKLPLSDIGIKGSSQGAAKVPYILSQMPELKFGVVVSCPGTTLLESDLNYWKNRNKSLIGPQAMHEAENLQRTVFQFIAGNIQRSQVDSEASKYQNEPWFKYVWIPEENEISTDKKLNYSPMPHFEKVIRPLLVIQGSMDEIIPFESISNIKKTMGKNKKGIHRFVLLEGADHSMMYRGTSDFPYWSALHPDYLPAMLKWMNHF